MSFSPILLPILALVAWSLFMQVWMVITRLPAMAAANIDAQEAQRTQTLGERLPKNVQSKADNYNHLMEHPTIFYATALALAVAGLGVGLNLILAWCYVGIRIAHSLVQVSINIVMIRFSLFALSSLMLLAMVVNGFIAIV